jgi:tight adherence protein C
VTLLLILGLALVGVTVALAGRALILTRQRTAASLTGIERYGFTSPGVADDDESRSAINDLASFLGETVGRRFGVYREAQLRQDLISAGMYRISARQLFGYQLLCGFAFAAVWVWLMVTSGGNTGVAILGTLVLGGLGWIAPASIVRRRARDRLTHVDYGLPELIDLLVVSIEAGVAFATSLVTASERLRGPLGDELRLANQEQRMGLATSDALENMLLRCPTDMMRSFVRAVVEGEKLGVSMGQIMRNLAVEMRKRRRQLAEERAQKAPIKMLFPLVFMIFPAMFVVLLGPAMFQIVETLGHT